MAAQNENILSHRQLLVLEKAFQQGATDASDALVRWLGRPSLICVESVEQLALDEATRVLGTGDQPICFCVADMIGALTGELILAFDDASGLALADILLDQPLGTANAWEEMEVSAVLETTNIVSCAYFNSLSRTIIEARQGTSELLPSPPRFSHDFAESLVQFALMGQAVASDHAVFSRTQFHIDGEPIDWTLLLVPDEESMQKLRRWLPTNSKEGP